MKLKYNNFFWGFIPALLLPIIIFLFTWGHLYTGDLSFWASLKEFFGTHLMQQYILFCSLPDLIILFVAYKMERWKACSGAFLGLFPFLCLLFLNF